MVAKLEAVMLANPGASSVTTDGVTVQMRDLKAEWQYWTREVARQGGMRPTIIGLDLSGF